jgi:putative peptidoglycan binding protein
MPWHTVSQGEWIGKIAHDYGISNWRTIYDHGENADLRAARPDPNLLYEGDRVFVPEMEVKYVDGATDKRHVFKQKAQKLKLKIGVKNAEDKPIASKPYKLTIHGKEYRGNTDGSGTLEQEIPMPASDEEGLLEVDGYHYPVRVGHLDPIGEISGIQQRLNNLGFECGPADGSLNEKTVEAVTMFQSEAGIEPTGELDQNTRNKLKDKHGS